jgi:peroxiredoxin Q/BCP
MLNVNDKAPDFTLQLTSGRNFNLHTTLRNSSVLINFIRGTWCEECTNHLKRVEAWKEKLNHRVNPVTTIIITVEEEQKVKDWLKENPNIFLMASDPDGSVAKAFGYMVPEDAYSKPGIVLIDRDQVIRTISDDLKKSREQAAKALELED